MSINPTDVMTSGERLIEQHPETFTDDFSRNKQAVQRMLHLDSMHHCDRIAGYITRKQRSA